MTLTEEQKQQVYSLYPGSQIISSKSIGSGGEVSVIVRPKGAYIGQEKEVRVQPQTGQAVVAGGYFGEEELRGKVAPELEYARSRMGAGQIQRQEAKETGKITRLVGYKDGEPVLRERKVGFSPAEGRTKEVRFSRRLQYQAAPPVYEPKDETTVMELKQPTYIIEFPKPTSWQRFKNLVLPTRDKFEAKVGKGTFETPSLTPFFGAQVTYEKGVKPVAKLVEEKGKPGVTKSVLSYGLKMNIAGFEEIKAKPVTFEVKAAAGYGAGRVLGSVANIPFVSKVSSSLPLTKAFLGGSLAGAYVGTVALETKGEPRALGRKTVQDLPIFVGLQAGMKKARVIKETKLQKEFEKKTKFVKVTDVKQKIRAQKLKGKEVITGTSKIKAKVQYLEPKAGYDFKEVKKIDDITILRGQRKAPQPLTPKQDIYLKGQVEAVTKGKVLQDKFYKPPKNLEVYQFIGEKAKDPTLAFTKGKFSLTTSTGKGVKQMKPITLYGAATSRRGIVYDIGTDIVTRSYIKPYYQKNIFYPATKVGKGYKAKVYPASIGLKEESIVYIKSYPKATPKVGKAPTYGVAKTLQVTSFPAKEQLPKLKTTYFSSGQGKTYGKFTYGEVSIAYTKPQFKYTTKVLSGKETKELFTSLENVVKPKVYLGNQPSKLIEYKPDKLPLKEVKAKMKNQISNLDKINKQLKTFFGEETKFKTTTTPKTTKTKDILTPKKPLKYEVVTEPVLVDWAKVSTKTKQVETLGVGALQSAVSQVKPTITLPPPTVSQKVIPTAAAIRVPKTETKPKVVSLYKQKTTPILEPKTDYKLKSKGLTRVEQDYISIEEQKQKNKSLVREQFIQPTKYFNTYRPEVKLQPVFKPVEVLKTPTIQAVKTIIPTIPRTPRIFTPTPVTRTIPEEPPRLFGYKFGLKPGKGGFKLPKIGLGTRAFKYRPSLLAIGQSIRGVQPKVLTGAGIRPLPLKKKKKRRS